MCGIAGFIEAGCDEETLGDQLGRMTAAIVHRGPDSDGHWLDPEAGVALGHRRLAIVDLSPTGHQPMSSASGKFMIVFNGEIYNHATLRNELEALGWRSRGTSDTEVMLAAFEQWGIEASVKRFVGMFAFALWNRETRTLTLGRDRMGEKPLYYGWAKDTFLFSSELKSLRGHPAWRGEIDRGALALMMRHNYIPAPHSIYSGIYKLTPGTLLTIESRSGAERELPAPIPYWSLRTVVEAGVSSPFSGSEVEAVEALETLLSEAVGNQMMADVPIGAFLSGGIDSSTIVALMQAQSSRPVKTFTIGFHEAGFNEAEHAKAVARHLGTEHTELYVTPKDAMEVIPRLPSIYNEPFSDSSQIPTFLVAQLARQHVTVSLSGDAGDELFAGYKRYETGRALWNKIAPVPPALRGPLADLIRHTPIGVWNGLFSWAGPTLAHHGRPGPVGDKLHKLAEILDAPTAEALYRRLVSHWHQTKELTLGASELPTVLTDITQQPLISDLTERMMYWDCRGYLPDDILVKVDRAAMGVSLETRVPMLDHRVVELAWQLPMKMKVRDGQSKWALRQVLFRHVPRELLERPKLGFGVPVGDWLRGPLREWAEELLRETRLRQEGYLDPLAVREKWNQHLSGSRNWQSQLWNVLMFQAWLETTSSSSPLILERSLP